MASEHDNSAPTSRSRAGYFRNWLLSLVLTICLVPVVCGAAPAVEHPAGSRFPSIVVYVGFG